MPGLSPTTFPLLHQQNLQPWPSWEKLIISLSMSQGHAAHLDFIQPETQAFRMTWAHSQDGLILLFLAFYDKASSVAYTHCCPSHESDPILPTAELWCPAAGNMNRHDIFSLAESKGISDWLNTTLEALGTDHCSRHTPKQTECRLFSRKLVSTVTLPSQHHKGTVGVFSIE